MGNQGEVNAVIAFRHALALGRHLKAEGHRAHVSIDTLRGGGGQLQGVGDVAEEERLLLHVRQCIETRVVFLKLRRDSLAQLLPWLGQIVENRVQPVEVLRGYLLPELDPLLVVETHSHDVAPLLA